MLVHITQIIQVASSSYMHKQALFLTVAAFFIICVSSDRRLSNSPVLVTSKNAISWLIIHRLL